ncbi:diacylglycerol kinase [Candidatus Peregrinibacteria bacterium CG10_big_fil_rev_8_21_14_0_10_55_24]|nr:MAG: diacylglycerol kinase [Candidatus Peregrinibacteria bacterium CG10_big_fil_rev_8_21_14_0_10_55_24]
MNITLIAAASENSVIGRKGAIPWKLPEDFRHFHVVTTGKPIIMGRKTHESIGRVLPGRRNIVVTRQDMEIDGCEVVHSIEEAIALLERDGVEEACVIGGGEIYAQALPFATHIDLTRVHMDVPNGDAFFPAFSGTEWREVSRQRHEADEEHAVPFTFLLYEKK